VNNILNSATKKLYKTTAEKLQGSDRRKFMAQVVQNIGYGGQSYVEKHLGWNRTLIRKGAIELSSGKDFVDRFSDRGRKKAEVLLPTLLEHIRLIVEPKSQTDPTFRSTRTYIPVTAASVRQSLIKQFKYSSKELPCVRTISNKLNDMGFRPMKVAKCKPLKK